MAVRERAIGGRRLRRALVRPVPVVAGLLGLASACLNPQPDEEPTFNDSKQPRPAGPIDVSPEPETCDHNPSLAGCGPGNGALGPPASDTSGAGGSSSTSANGGAGGGAGSAGSAGSAGDAGSACADERDAGPDDAVEGAGDAG